MSHYQDQIEDLTKKSDTQKTLNDRGTAYGDFRTHAALSQALKNGIMQHYFQVHGGSEAPPMEPHMAEAITLICHKLARIANGDPKYIDSWRDIAGYAELEVSILKQDPEASDVTITKSN